ncbi:sulfite exporter TauE/SafE family protein [Pseudomonas sp. UMAB-08]|uniref:sulfite exporter TauE/SafE family protein n=1 Tax=Pseudomonas sp. UMAB-08 TaxID=1365375 RepID=UPI001C5777E3|nr:sulfite exporter TauE/SafE family protein [Pseudomonas sp. UMAB-08]
MVYASFLLIALLYASVGQVGASGYIAVMALLGFAPESIKPTALVLNTLVSLLVTWRFMHVGRLNWKLLWPFAFAAVPMALLGGHLTLPMLWFDRLLGSLLLVAGIPFFLKKPNEASLKPPFNKLSPF